MTHNLEHDLKNIYRKHAHLNTLCIAALLGIIAFLGILMMTLGNTNYSLKEVLSYLMSSETKGAAYNIKTIRNFGIYFPEPPS